MSKAQIPTNTHYSIAEMVIAAPDIHFPLANMSLLEKFYAFVEERYQEFLDKKYAHFTIVQMGDICDFDTFSKYLTDPRSATSATKAIEQARAFFAHLRKIAPLARICFKEGNHDVRLQKYILEKAPALIELAELDLNHLYHLEKNGVEFFRTTDRLVLEGGLKLTHGDRHSSAGSSYTAMAELRACEAGLSMITAHIHTFAHVFTPDRFALVCGYFGSMEPGAFKYIGDRLPTCRAGFAVALRIRMDERDKRGRFRGSKTQWVAQPVEAFGPKHDSFFYGGKIY